MRTSSLFPDPCPPERRVSPEDVELMVERTLAAPVVDVTQVPMHHASRPESGEMRLALAILDDAIRCVIRHARSRLPHQKAEAMEALAWIQSDREDYALCFVPICQLFSIDPEWIRDLVARALRDPSSLRGTWNPGFRDAATANGADEDGLLADLQRWDRQVA